MQIMQRAKKLIKQHPYYTIVAAVILFILFVIIASLYSNAVVWNLNTSNGLDTGMAVGRGGRQSVTQTLVQYDGFQYAHIAQYGYSAVSYTAFLPLYPLLIRAVAKVTHLSIDYSGLAVAWLSLVASAIVVFKWVRFEFDKLGKKISPWMVLGLFAVFPTSAFFVYDYTESTFLLLNVAAIFLYRKNKYVLAGLVAALSSAAHDQGILLSLFFLADFWLTRKQRDYRKLIPVVLCAVGLGTYMAYLAVHFGNPLEFIVAERGWDRVNGNVIVGLIHSMRPLYLWFIPVAGVGLWSIWRYLGRAYFVYSLAFLALPIITGNLTSFNRYMLSLFPMFLGLAILGQEATPKPVRSLYLTSSAFLLAWSILLFANGYWVA